MPVNADTESSMLRRTIAASAIGNATEWFDYGVYTYGVTYISSALFPGSITEATLFALSAFATSFLVRPLGGLIWGPIGDRRGRKFVLALTILLMSAATFCIGIIPSYDAIGLWAPALLTVFRLLQGFSTGGEYSGAATFMAEHAPDHRRGFYGSFLEFGTLAGFSCGALLMLGFTMTLGDAAMHAWGWRLPFLIAGPLGLVGLYLRSRIAETPIFQEAQKASVEANQPSDSLLSLCRDHWPPMVVLALLVIALNVVNYTLLSYMPTYLQIRLGLTTEQALYAPIIGMLAMMLFIPLAGHLSDVVGRKRLWWISLIGLFVCAIPAYQLMATGTAGAMIGISVLGMLYVPQLATISATFPAMFPTRVRFAALAISYNTSTSLFGGTAPAFNSWLIERTGNLQVPAYTMMCACLIGMAALPFLRETARQSLRDVSLPDVNRPASGGT
ncbi:MAG: MFS transporter [Rhodospirillaceae bacterium]|nr:MFS transporter [Rhodospirillaceae bacterium]